MSAGSACVRSLVSHTLLISAYRMPCARTFMRPRGHYQWGTVLGAGDTVWYAYTVQYCTMENKRDAQLSAKRQLVSDQLEVAKDHLETLRTKCNLVELHSKRISDFVSDTFADLKRSLDKKEKEVVSKILVDSSRIKEELNTVKKSAELIIERSRQVRFVVYLRSDLY